MRIATERAALIRGPLNRRDYFAVLLIGGLINAVTPTIKSAFLVQSFGHFVLAGGGLNAIVWLSSGLAIRAILHTSKDTIDRQDILCGIVYLALVLWPLGETSWVALTLLSGYILLKYTIDDYLRAGSAIIAALCFAMLWAKAVAGFIAAPLELLDTKALSLVTGLKTQGNLVFYADGSGGAAMSWGCTSFSNASMAFLLWIALTRSLRPVPNRSERLSVLAVFGCVFMLNSTRLLLTMRSHEIFHFWHDGEGASVINAAMLSVTVVLALWGARRELLA